MNAVVHADARTEAAKVNRCLLNDFDSEYVNLLEVCTLAEPPGSRSLKEAAHKQKPRTYGLIGKLVTAMLRRTFDERSSLGVLGLRVRAEDVPSPLS